MLLTDVVKPYVVEVLIKGAEESMEINKEKYLRQGLVCAILSCLIDITEVKYIDLVVKHFLIQDYDKNLASNPQNMIAVLNQMLDNTIQKEE